MEIPKLISTLKKIKNINIPKHRIIKINYSYSEESDISVNLESLWKEYGEQIYKIFEKFDYPVFVRTELYSSSKLWEKTCFVNGYDIIKDNILNLFKSCFEKSIKFNYLIISETLPFVTTKIKSNNRISYEYNVYINDNNDFVYEKRWCDENIPDLSNSEIKTLTEITHKINEIKDLKKYIFTFSKDIKDKLWLTKIFLNNKS